MKISVDGLQEDDDNEGGRAVRQRGGCQIVALLLIKNWSG